MKRDPAYPDDPSKSTLLKNPSFITTSDRGFRVGTFSLDDTGFYDLTIVSTLNDPDETEARSNTFGLDILDPCPSTEFYLRLLPTLVTFIGYPTE